MEEQARQFNWQDVSNEAQGTGLKRSQAWKSILAACTQDYDELISGNCQELVGLIQYSLKYADKQSINSVKWVVYSALKNQQFLKMFAGMLVKQNAKKLDRIQKKRVASWISLVLQYLDAKEQQKAVHKLIEVQSEILTGLLQNIKPQELSKLIHSNLLTDYFVIMTAACQPGLVAAVTEFLHANPTEMQKYKKKLLDLYCEQVINNKERHAWYRQGFAPLIRYCCTEDMDSSLMPVIIKQTKRAPDSVLQMLPGLLEDASEGPAQTAADFMNVLLNMVRHSRENVRNDAAASLEQLAKLPCSQQVYSQLSECVIKVLVEAKPKQVPERVAILEALYCLGRNVDAQKEKVSSDDVQKVVTFLGKYCEEEGSEEARIKGLQGLGVWLGLHNDFPQQVTKLINKGLSGKESALRHAYLKCLASTLQSNPFSGTDFNTALEKILADGIQKPTLRSDGVVALDCLVQLASHDKNSPITASEVFSKALKPESTLLLLETVVKLPEEDCVYLSDACATALNNLDWKLQEVGSLDDVCQILILLCLYKDETSRRQACIKCEVCANKSGYIQQQLLTALVYWLINWKRVTEVAQTGSEEDGISMDILRYRFKIALRCCCGSILSTPLPTPTPISVAILLLVSHHPLLLHRQIDEVWNVLDRKVKKLLPNIISTSGAETCEQLQKYINYEDVQIIKAAQLAFAVAVKIQQSIFQQVLDIISPFLERSQYDQISEKDVFIFKTIPGRLASEMFPDMNSIPGLDMSIGNGPQRIDKQREDALSSVPQKQSKPVQKSGGKKGAPGKQDAAAREAEMRKQNLAEEAEVRARVEGIKQKLEVGVVALSFLCSYNRHLCRQHLNQLSPLILPLMSSKVISEDILFKSLQNLVSCLPSMIAKNAQDVVGAIKLVIEVENMQEIGSKEYVKSAVKAIHEHTMKRGCLSSSEYSLVFPLLKALLLLPYHTSSHDNALEIAAEHIQLSVDVSQEETIYMLYQALAYTPVYGEQVTYLLQKVCGELHSDREVECAMKGLLYNQQHVRHACLQSIPFIPGFGERKEGVALIWLALNDIDESNRETAQQLKTDYEFELNEENIFPIVSQLGCSSRSIVESAAHALEDCIDFFPDATESLMNQWVLTCYNADNDLVSAFGAAKALAYTSQYMSQPLMLSSLDFILSKGMQENREDIRKEMLSSGIAIVNVHGAEHSQEILQVLNKFAEKKKTKNEVSYDRVREGCVVFMGTLARHFDPEDPRVKEIITTLISVLKTPSEPVQQSVSSCLSPLMSKLKEDKEYMGGIIQSLMTMLVKGQISSGKGYAERRGAAFGLSGVVAGVGVSAFKEYGIMDTIKAYIEDKKDACKRQGALIAFECLFQTLGRKFEPYIISIIPMLLTSLGDAQVEVRDAATDAAKAVMKQLTSSGVKMVLPALVKGLDERTWRTKQGSVQMLGSMAHCAPKQLSTCLPTVVPKISEVLADPHPKVQEAARTALQEVGSVIRNPEIQQLVPLLLSAISDPNINTKKCLETLLDMTFVNTVDAASLSLVVPVLYRGLRDRSGDTKKRAAKIMGSMSKLVNNPKDLEPYVDSLVPELRAALIDPLPEVRSSAAKALGSMIGAAITDQRLESLMVWLIDTLKSEVSSVERSGGAQGLAEVLAVLGEKFIQQIVEQAIEAYQERNPFVREGQLTLFRYLPYTAHDQFQQHLQFVLPIILDGLADEAEGVRDSALAAGRTFVDMYAQSSLNLLLPAVEAGIFNENWRIRLSSVQLMGDLLYKISGTSGKIMLDGDSDDEGPATEVFGQNILVALGLEARNGVLARLYIARSDVQYPVRQAAAHVWKQVVKNTPKTLGEMLHSLMDTLIENLAQPGEEGRLVASRCLGELVRKMGDRVMNKIIPIMQEEMSAEDPLTRQGVCQGLAEVLDNLTREQIGQYISGLMPPIQLALCDADSSVRESAGAAFNILFKGSTTVADTVVPQMLQKLDSGGRGSQEALEGLRVIVQVRQSTLNSIIPKLLRRPHSVAKISAVGYLSEVAGPILNQHIGHLLDSLLSILQQSKDEDLVAAATQSASRVVLSVQEDGLHLLISSFLKGMEEANKRNGTAVLIQDFCKGTKVDFSEHSSALLSAVVSQFSDEDPDTIQKCWEASAAVVGSIPKEDQPSYVRILRESLNTAREKQQRKRKGEIELLIPALSLPKSLEPLLPIYLEGVLQGGSADIREMAAEGLGEMVRYTDRPVLEGFVNSITGPLIRIIGDKFPSQIKAAILSTLGLVVQRGGKKTKPFVPQLQTMFIKCLIDPAEEVRERAANNLGELGSMILKTRVDGIGKDLVTNATNSKDPQIQVAYLRALAAFILSTGERLSEDSLQHIGDCLAQVLENSVGDDSEDVRTAVSYATGVYCTVCGEEQLSNILQNGPLSLNSQQDKDERYANAMILTTIAKVAPARLDNDMQQVVKTVTAMQKDTQSEIRIAACRACGRLIQHGLNTGDSKYITNLIPILVALLGQDQGSDVVLEAMKALRTLEGSALVAWYVQLVPALCGLYQATAGPVKVMTENTLGSILQLEHGQDAAQEFVSSGKGGAMVKSTLTEQFLRRLQRTVGAADEGVIQQEQY